MDSINSETSTSDYQILASTILGKTKNPYKINKCMVSASTLNDKFEIPDGFYSVTGF